MGGGPLRMIFFNFKLEFESTVLNQIKSEAKTIILQKFHALFATVLMDELLIERI